MLRRLCCFVFVLAVTSAVAFGQTENSAEGLAYFEKHIRPVLVKECYECHSSESKEIEGGLVLDTRAGIRKGGETGPAVVPRNSRRSLLLKAIRQTDDDMAMPPDKKLSDETIAAFEKWIAMGAPDPRDGDAVELAKKEIDIEAGRKFWSFQPPKQASPPKVKNEKWPKTDIDRFLLARLEAADLQPVADADPRTLLRRLYFDLIGIPPSPQQAANFEEAYQVNPEQAIQKQVSDLLESPQFGERWARHWLDVARFGESTGQAANIAYPHAWRYRDWVIDAFNQDMPYDQFIRAQLAGDLLEAETPNAKAANQIATGFLAIGPKSVNERNRKQFRMDVADEQIDTTFQAFQGLTVACARCHDHKFDPIEQRDYYAVAGIFRSTETLYGTIRIVQSIHPSPLIELPEKADVSTALPTLSSTARGRIESQIERVREQIAESDDQLRNLFSRNRIALLQSQLDSYDDEGDAKKLAMGVREATFKIDSSLYVRGESDQPSGLIPRGVPQVLAKKQPYISRRSSGRKELADFIASESNPLTARVMVNRVWQHLIGQGLVTTPDNFGTSGNTPTHPELLDHLAVSFMQNDWSVKQLIRSIVTSRAYQLASTFNEKNFKVDPENELVWRMPLRRLEAEALRDAMLLTSGRLDLTPPVGSVVARNGEGNIARFGPLQRDTSMTDNHRSVYLPIVRDQIPEVLALFDFPDPSLISGTRSTTTIPAQSLFLMNNSGVIRLASEAGDKIMKLAATDEQRIALAYELCYTRKPSDTELNAALNFLFEFEKTHTKRATWAAFCQAMFAGAEFAYR